MTELPLLVRLRRAVEALPEHSISGYESECGDCAYVWGNSGADGRPSTPSGYVDTAGNPYGREDGADHQHLLDRGQVLALLEEIGGA